MAGLSESGFALIDDTSAVHPLSARSLSVRAVRLWPIWVVALAGLVLRVYPLVAYGPLGRHLDPDEGTYFSTGALLARGSLPYLDVVAVQPPGIFYLLAPLSLIGAPHVAFGVASAVMAAIGAANVFLVGVITARWSSIPAAAAGAALAAVFPQTVALDRGIFTEPLLTLFACSPRSCGSVPVRPRSPPRGATIS